MARSDAFSRNKSTRATTPDFDNTRRRLAMQALSPLYENIDAIARSIVGQLENVNPEHLPSMVRVLSLEFKTSLDSDWAAYFLSSDDLNHEMADGLQRVRIGISSGLMFGGFKHCRVKKIVLDPVERRFTIDLHWVTEPSRLRRLLARHH